MDEHTGFIGKQKGESTLFNTSIRGWGFLMLMFGLIMLMIGIVIAPYLDVEIPERVSAPLITLFVGTVSGIASVYIHQKSTEGQNK